MWIELDSQVHLCIEGKTYHQGDLVEVEPKIGEPMVRSGSAIETTPDEYAAKQEAKRQAKEAADKKAAELPQNSDAP